MIVFVDMPQTMAVRLAVCLLLLAISPPFTSSSCPQIAAQPDPQECVNVSANIDCRHLYQQSFFPNHISESYDEAVSVVATYLFSGPGRTYQNCSRYIALHVCLAAQPLCETDSTEGTPRIRIRPPCKDLCRQVETDCSRQLDTINDASCVFNCNQWPETNCIGLDDPIVTQHVPPIVPEPAPTTTVKPDTRPTQQPGRPLATPTATTVPSQANGSCPPDSQTYFRNDAKRFAKGWVAFWSVCCFLSTLVTLLTFFLDTSRFQYPWRPVVYLALSFHIHTLGYFLAFIVGPDTVTCPGGSYVETEGKWTWAHTPCILVFGLLYYSMIAAFLWWLILTLSWFLSSAYKWTNEAISQFALFYHAAAWVIPLILTISLLAAKVVSADELTGTCFIVRTDTHVSYLALLLGLILPLAIFLLLGTLFLCIGFVSLLQIRRFMVHRGKARESVILEKLMIRIGVYVAIYIIPAAILIGCFIYELDTRPHWHTVGDPCTNCSRPNTAVFMARVFMFLLIGVLTGVWIWSRKTLQSWQKMPVKLRGCVFPPQTAERTQDNTEKTAAQLHGFTSPPRPHPVARHTPSYPYSIESGTEFST